MWLNNTSTPLFLILSSLLILKINHRSIIKTCFKLYNKIYSKWVKGLNFLESIKILEKLRGNFKDLYLEVKNEKKCLIRNYIHLFSFLKYSLDSCKYMVVEIQARQFLIVNIWYLATNESKTFYHLKC